MIPVAGRGITRRDALRLGLGIPIAWAGAFTNVSRGDGAAERPSERIYFDGELILDTERLKGTFAVDPETGTWVRITTEGNPTAQVSPDGRWLAFSRYVQDGNKKRGLWVCDIRGAVEPRRIADLVGKTYWSRDGKHLVISGPGRSDDNNRLQAWMVRADGSEPTRLPIPETDFVLDWSPDDAWFLISSNRDGGQDYAKRPVYVVRTDGKEERLVTGACEMVRWRHRFAAGGRKVVYVQVEENEDCRLWIVDLVGRNPRLFLGEQEDRAPFDAIGSPDGRRAAILYFDRTPDDDGKRNDIIRGCTIEIADADGTNARPLSLPEAGRLSLLGWC